MSPETSGELRPGDPAGNHRTVTLVWGGLLGGLTLYAVVAVALVGGALTGEPGGLAADPGPIGEAFVLLAPLALGLAAVGMVLRRKATHEVGRGGEGAALSRWFGTSVSGWAFAEGAGLLVVTMGLLAGRVGWVFAGWALGAVTLLLGRVSRDEVERVSR